MIKVLSRGKYKIIKASETSKNLVLDDATSYLWNDKNELSIESQIFTADYKMLGNFRLYDVENEDKYTNGQHLELQTGCGCWQSYLLPQGLPTSKNKNINIIETEERLTITNNCCQHSSTE